MPLARYGVLAGSVVDRRAEGGTDTPPYQIHFIRANLFDRQAMRPMPATAPGPDNDLADKLDHFVRRAAADPSARVPVTAPVQLGNRGGLITLLDPNGLKVDGVAYTQGQADAEGWSIVF